MYLNFSDTAKFADIARNLINHSGYSGNFTFWNDTVYKCLTGLFPQFWIPPVMSFSIVVFFKIFGVNDFAIIATSFFYFLLTLIFVYLLSKKIYKSNLVGVLSTLAVGFNYDLINYATNGASESPFIFEIVVTLYLVSLRKKWATVVAVLLLILMYFTRPQAFIYIAGIILFWLIMNFKISKAVLMFIGVLISGLLIDRLILTPLGGKFFLYSITGRGVNAALGQAVSSSASDTLRGAVGLHSVGLVQIAKNIFYNFYNFYKLLPQIMSPYLFAIFVIGLFRPMPEATERRAFKIASAFMVIVTFLVAAASIPFFRYIHPVIPLIYIVAVGTIVSIISNQLTILKLKISKQTLVIIISTFMIVLFGVGQTLGILLLDSRFERNTHNVGKPPVYVVLSQILKQNTNPNQVVITNLDTWGSWYGERKTVWFPLMPKQLIDPATGKIPFDAIYLTSYLIDDQNYYMGEDWRQIFNNPKDSTKWICDGCPEIAKEFTLMRVYQVNAGQDYERQGASAILLIKK